MNGSDLASLTDTVASLYTKQKVKQHQKKYPKQSHAVMTLNEFEMCLILTFQRNVWWSIFNKYLHNKDTATSSCWSWQFLRNFEDVSPFISVNIHFKVKPLQPNRTRDIALQLP